MKLGAFALTAQGGNIKTFLKCLKKNWLKRKT